MAFTDKIRSAADFLGMLVVEDNFRKLEFYSPHTNAKGKGLHTFFTNYGDCVYFMFVGDQLMKIGKAAAQQGWMSRANQYKVGVDGDTTNKLILKNLKEMDRRVIEVLGIRTPRQQTTVGCVLTGVSETVEIEMAGTFEKMYTQRFLNENEENFLPFCKQLK